ncbi:MAG: lysylphosphatidylglycerol synthase transmembrane domain-containing protein [Tissierellia bacterium]|nr:lysylphosphatidylglycerol synthase transmembrane domain-containing protein [Tissierellia bacterium]
MENKNAKKVGLILLSSLAILFFLYKKTNPKEMGRVLQRTDHRFLILAFLSFLAYLFFEAISYRYLLKKFHYPISIRRSWAYAFVDYFFSIITPGGSGGQPGQLYFMLRDGISPGACMMSLFPFNMVYHICLATMSLFFVFHPASEPVRRSLLRPFIVYGIGAQLFFVILLMLFTFSENKVLKMVKKLFSFIGKIPLLKRLTKYEERLDRSMGEYQECTVELKKEPLVFIYLIPMIFMMLICSYSIPYWVYRALGYDQLNFIEILAIQTLIIVAVESVPIPGSLGITEAGMLDVLSKITNPSGAFTWMFLNRVSTLYFGLLLGGIVLTTMKKRVIERENPLEEHRKKRSIGGRRTINDEVKS